MNHSTSITNSRSSPKPMSIELVMPPSHLIPCRPLLLLPSSFPSLRVFSNESALPIRWTECWRGLQADLSTKSQSIQVGLECDMSLETLSAPAFSVRVCTHSRVDMRVCTLV